MLSFLLRKGLRKGVLGGSRPWTAVGIAAGLVALARRVASRRTETVYRQPLRPGEGLLVRVREPEEAPPLP